MTRGKIMNIQPRRISTVYSYICIEDDNNFFSFPVEARYHKKILEGIGDPIGRRIEYDNAIDPPLLRFLNRKPSD
jgi:hypothetical protein